LKKRFLVLLIGIIALLFVCSLTLNIYLINRTHQAEAYAMDKVYNDFRLADENMNSNKQYSMGMLAEAGGNLIALQNVPFVTKRRNLNNNLFYVGYYLHSLSTPVSTNGMTDFVKKAEILLQSHIMNGKYETTFLNSDAKHLNQLVPKNW
jgi:hypothetical protein